MREDMSSESQVQIFVDLRIGGHKKTRSVTCPASWKIAQLIAHVSNKCSLARSLSINKQGKKLHPDQTISSAGIKVSETLTIALPLPGGMMFSIRQEEDDDPKKLDNAVKESANHKEYYNPNKSAGFLKAAKTEVTQEDLQLLEEHLNPTSFYSKLNPNQKKWFKTFFLAEQVNVIKSIDQKLGCVKDDESAIHLMFEQLNKQTAEQREALMNAFTASFNDNGAKKEEYLYQLFDVDGKQKQIADKKKKQRDKDEAARKRNPKEAAAAALSKQGNVSEQEEERDPVMDSYFLAWKTRHVFWEENKSDMFFVKQLMVKNIVCLDADLSLKPIVDPLDLNQRLEIIRRLISKWYPGKEEQASAKKKGKKVFEESEEEKSAPGSRTGSPEREQPSKGEERKSVIQSALNSALLARSRETLAGPTGPSPAKNSARAGEDENLNDAEQMNLALEFIEACSGAIPQSQSLNNSAVNAWTMLRKLIDLVDDGYVKHFLFVMSKAEDKNSDKLVTNAYILKQVSHLYTSSKSDGIVKKDFKQQKKEFLSFWDSLTPKQQQLQHQALNDSTYTHLKKFYFDKLLDLDSKVEFLDSIESYARGESYARFEKDKKTRIPQDKKKIFYERCLQDAECKSLVEHHQFYHLNEEDSDDEDDQQKDEDMNAAGKLVTKETEFSKHLKKVESEMCQAWQYVPQHMTGQYKQGVHNPMLETQFIMIQPLVIEENKSVNYTQAKLNNPQQEKDSKGIQGQQVQLVESEQESENKRFSVISYWDFSPELNNNFECSHAFMSKPVIPFTFGYQTTSQTKRQYLFTSREREVFFFCQDKIQDAAADAQDALAGAEDRNHLYLCFLKESNSYEKSGHNMSGNLQSQIEIEQGSPLYQYVKPSTQTKYLNTRSLRFNQTPPTLIRLNKKEGSYLVFSMFKAGDCGPTLYFHSLNTNKVEAEVKGGEIFVDFIPAQLHAPNGSLYFMTDKYFFDNKWAPINDSLKLSQVCKEGETVLVRAQFSLGGNKTSDLVQIKQLTSAALVGQALTKDFGGQQKEHPKLKMPEGKTEFSMVLANIGALTRITFPIQKSSNHIISIEPLQRAGQQLEQFAIIAEENLTKQLTVRVMQLSNNQNSNSYIQHAIIEPPGLKWAYIHRQGEQGKSKNVIQAVVENDEDYEIMFYIPSQQSEEQKDNSLASNIINRIKGDGYVHQITKSMGKKNLGQLFIPMQVGMITDRDDIFGCFFDKQNFSVHWYHERLIQSTKKYDSYLITDGASPKYTVQYPVLCYRDALPDRRQLVLCNLADMKSNSQKLIDLENMQFINFVGHSSIWSDQTKVCFLAKDFSDPGFTRIVHCIINCKRMLQKKQDNDLSYLCFDKEYLGPLAEQTNFTDKLINIVRIESVHEFNRHTQCYVIQYKDAVYVYDLWRNQPVFVQVSQRMRPITMQRSTNNTFYFVESDALGTTDIIVELSIQESKDKRFTHSTRPAYTLNSGQVLALEMNPDISQLDFTFMENSDDVIKKFVQNELFFIDDSLQIFKLIRDTDTTYEVQSQQQNLLSEFSDLQNLQLTLKDLKNQKFPRMTITDTCLTIGGINVSLTDKMSWNFQYNVQPSEDEQTLPASDLNWQVKSVQNIDSTHRQILRVKQKGHTQIAFVVKPQPNNRIIDLIGKQAIRAVEQVEFITNKLLLIKLRGGYWTMMTTNGQVQEIPQGLMNILNEVPFDIMTSNKLAERGKTQIMLQSAANTTVILFNHKGQVLEYDQYKSSEEEELDARFDQLPSIFSDPDGQIYRIFNFTDARGEKEDPSVKPVQISRQISDQNPNNTLINIAFLCLASDKAPKIFTVCGDFIVWQRPEWPEFKDEVEVEDEVKANSNSTIYYIQVQQILDKCDFSKEKIKSIQLTFPQNADEYNRDIKRVDFKQYLTPGLTEFNLSPAPYSTHLSQRTNQKMEEYKVEKNLLQVTIRQRSLILHLDQTVQKTTWIKDFSDMQQLVGPRDFVCSEVHLKHCTKGVFSGQLQHQILSVVHNCSKDFYFIRKYYRTVDKAAAGSGNPFTPRILQGAYKTHTEMDLMQLKNIKTHIEENKQMGEFDIECTLSMYKGKSVFSMQLDYPELFSVLEKQFESIEFEAQVDRMGSQIENQQTRRLFQVLMTTIPNLKCKVQADNKLMYSMYSVLEMQTQNQGQSLASDSTNKLEVAQKQNTKNNSLLNISMKCNGVSLVAFADTQYDVLNLLNGGDAEITNKILLNSFVESRTTRKITSVKYPQGLYKNKYANLSSMAFSYKNCLIDQNDIERELENVYTKQITWYPQWLPCLKPEKKLKEEMQLTSVKVQILDLAWLYTDQMGFDQFASFLQQKNIVSTEFARIMLDSFWDVYKTTFLFQVILPYLIYLGLTLYIMINVVCVEDHEITKWQKWLACALVLCIFLQFWIEKSQIKHSKGNVVGEYFMQYRNLCDIFMNSVNLFFTILAIFEVDWPTIENRRVMVAIMMCFIWIKMFEFLKVFDSTSFFIKLINDTIHDIGPFMMILPLFILAFGTSFMIINMERVDENDEQIMATYTGFWVWDVIVNQYLLALGDWEGVELNGSAVSLVTIFFVGATFLTFITAFNMLIAIMGDTFGKVLEGYDKHTRAMKLDILNNYSGYIELKTQEAAFIVLVTPTDFDEEDQWGGAIQMVRSSLNKNQESLHQKFNVRIDNIKEQIAEFKKSQIAENKEVKSQLQTLIKNQAKMATEWKELIVQSQNESAN